MKAFLKWAGSKREQIDILRQKLPNNFNNYFEPFVGAGNLLFALQHKQAYINDSNTALINCYIQIKVNIDKLIDNIHNLDDHLIDNKYYLNLRDRYNQLLITNQYDIECASLMIWLNKHAFNGLYRVNKKGLFNVPWNKSDKKTSLDIANLYKINKYLQNVNIYNDDYKAICNLANKDDFIYFDPPFHILNKTSKFTAYTKDGFDEQEQIQLSLLFQQLDKKGIKLMLSNHNTELINNLYKNYNKQVIRVNRHINSNGNKRTGEEIIITNFIKDLYK